MNLMALKSMERFPNPSATRGPLIIVCHSVPGKCHAYLVKTPDFVHPILRLYDGVYITCLHAL